MPERLALDSSIHITPLRNIFVPLLSLTSRKMLCQTGGEALLRQANPPIRSRECPSSETEIPDPRFSNTFWDLAGGSFHLVRRILSTP